MGAGEWQGRRTTRDAVLRRGAHLLVATAAAVASAVAFAWPDQPLTFVLPFSPGTGVDFLARQFASRLPAALGQAAIVENLPGAAGTIGTERVARAKPDGHTLLVQSLPFVTGPILYKTAKFDSIADFAPISLVGWSSYVLVVRPMLPARTVAELVAAAASPGKLTYATPGVGTPHHVATVLILQKAGVTMLHVPFRGADGALADLLAGRVDAMLLPVSVVLQHIRSGRLVALATGSLERLPQLPQVPTLAEARLDVGNLDLWYGVLAPKGTHASIVDRLNREIASAVASPGFASLLDAQGIVPATSTPAEFGRLLADERSRWTEVMERAGIRGE